MIHEALLQQMVFDELGFDPAIDVAHIGVAVHGSVVTLMGQVESCAEKYAAERAARRVKGVTGVAQEIEVRLPQDKKTHDDEIAQRALKMMEWNVSVPTGSVRVQVEHGVVLLEGTVDWGYQRETAEYDVRKLGGVLDVINRIQVRPRLTTEDVRGTLRAAFERTAEIEASRITIDVDGRSIKLGGEVDTWPERQEAERAAWSIPGVISVEDNIVIAQRESASPRATDRSAR